MQMTNYYCDSEEDRELFVIISSVFSAISNVNVTVIPGVVSRSAYRLFRASTLSNPKILKQVTENQALNIAMSHPLEKVTMTANHGNGCEEFPDLPTFDEGK